MFFIGAIAAVLITSGTFILTSQKSKGADNINNMALKEKQSLTENALIPRDILFGNPEKTSPALSPDGKKIAFVAPVAGVLNIWVAPADDMEKAEPLTADKGRGISTYMWTYASNHILYLQDEGGDENMRIYRLDINTKKTKLLTPAENVRAIVQGISPKFKEEILVGLNDRDPRFHDIYRLNFLSGEKSLVIKNEGWAVITVDDDFNPRFASRITENGGQEIFKRVKDSWETFIAMGPEDALTTGIIGLNRDGDTLYMQDSRGRDTSALFAFDLNSGEKSLLAEDYRADLGGVLLHPAEKKVQAAYFNYLRSEWKILDKAIEPDMEYLKSAAEGDLVVAGRTLADDYWLVNYNDDRRNLDYYLYNRKEKKATFLFNAQPKLSGYELSNMYPEIIKSRDGLALISYLSLPPWIDNGSGRPKEPLPMVLLVHGGPWHRDSWGYNPMAQWLANRGYAVLSVNFRGSTGVGKEFLNAGNLEWGKKMHDDLIDAVNWAVEENIAQEKKIAIMGGSYGGYAALAGLTFTPEVFAAGVDIVGPSNLITLMENPPPYWAPFVNGLFKQRMGDFTTPEGQARLKEVSPIFHVDKIKKPLLIGQGANDPRVKRSESDQITKAMEEKNIPVTYLLYPDEGHGFSRPENRNSFFAVTENFLAGILGGRAQSLGESFENSSMEVVAGAEHVSGLKEALK